MEKFILVSLDADKKVLKESIDLHGLVSKGFELKSDITSVCESMDVLSENGYRVIVEAETPFIHSEESSLNEGLGDLYNKLKEKFGGSKDEFEDWYEQRMAEKKEAGTDDRVGVPDSIKNRRASAAAATAAPIKGVSGGGAIATPSMKNRSVPEPRDSEADIKARQEQVKKTRRVLPATIGQIKNMFGRDRESFLILMKELNNFYEENWEKKIEDVAKI